jgi:hypothetical protein
MAATGWHDPASSGMQQRRGHGPLCVEVSLERERLALELEREVVERGEPEREGRARLGWWA